MVKAPWFSVWTAWVAFVPLMCGALAPAVVPKLVRKFVTWPRAGFVANPNEVKLSQLLKLMALNGALAGVWCILSLKVLPALGKALALGHSPTIVLMCIIWLAYVPLTWWLNRKVIGKRPPMPWAHDAEVMKRELKQTASGRKQLRWVWFGAVAAFIVVLMFVFGLVFGLVYGSKSLVQHAEIQWPQLGVATFLVATNAVLYLMASGVLLKPYRWKWFVLPVMLLAPILLAPAIPYPPAPPSNPESTAYCYPLMPVILCLGVVWFLSGAITLVLFIRRNPRPADEISAETL